MDNIDIRPILGRKACLGMSIIQYMDNDELHKPEVGNASVYTMKSASASGLNKADIIRQFPRVFAEEVGQLEGEYHIKLDTTIFPVQHAPRRVPVAQRDQLKAELDKMTEQGIITPVTAPTPWVSSLVVVPKKNGMLRLCLDPKDLNKAVQREHYPLPTIEDIATRLHGAKVFTKLDVRSGFWHITLDQASSYLTTFNTPFGRFRWRRMPFGIRSAPEVFQRRMHELIEGMPQVEVIADDFVVVEKGNTIEEANNDHDKNLVAFLRLCDEKGLKLNTEKLMLRQPEVSFIGHIATGEGLKVDPSKVKAIREMPAPTDIAGVQRMLGLAQYLGKFLPHLSDITKPLRELTQQDVEWAWDEPQKMALKSLKDAVTRTPLLQRKGRCHPPVRRVTVGARCSTPTEWATRRLCLQGSHPSGNSIRSNRERAPCDRIRMREVRLVYLWAGGYQGRKRPQAFRVYLSEASSRRSAATTKDAVAPPEIQFSDSIQEGQRNVPGGYSQPSTLNGHQHLRVHT